MSVKRRAFTVVELMLVILIITVLAALLFPVLRAARKDARMTVCRSNLRQLGMVYETYMADYGVYPDPLQLVAAVNDHRILRCPEDDGFVKAASSYTFRSMLPPDFQPYWSRPELPPNTVLLVCNNHQEQRRVVQGERRTVSEPAYPFKLALRSGGAVEQIHIDMIRERLVPGDRPRYIRVYPGEEGWDQARP